MGFKCYQDVSTVCHLSYMFVCLVYTRLSSPKYGRPNHEEFVLTLATEIVRLLLLASGLK